MREVSEPLIAWHRPILHILTAAYYILKDDVSYRELGADYFERRDKVNITRRLIRRLEGLGFSVEVRPAA